MSDKFIPGNKDLTSISRLLNKAIVTEQNVNESIDDWKKKPPDDKFKDILEAEIDE